MSMPELEEDRAVLAQILELLAHDLRNPLSALHSNLGYLKNVTPADASDPEVVEAISDGLASCEGLSHIIANLSVFAQLLRSAPQPQAVAAPAVVFVNDALKRTANTARTYGTTVELEVSAEARTARLSVSGELLSRALVNLVLNAVHCSPRRSTILLELSVREDSTVRLAMHDQGTPLEPGAESFGLGVQVASKTNPRGRYSRWLGLHVASITTNALGGTLESVPPKDGFASCLLLTLPSYRG
jgi:K+-sensing histidine kinase KdpD